MSVWYSTDRLKPFYGRRRVRKLCDHIDSLKRMLAVSRTEIEHQTARAERCEAACRHVVRTCYCQPSGQTCDVCRPAALALAESPRRGRNEAS